MHFDFDLEFWVVEQEAQHRHRWGFWMPFNPEEGINPETRGPDMEVNDTNTVSINRDALILLKKSSVSKMNTFISLQTVLGLQSLDGVLDAKLLSPKHILHNVFGVNKQGIVVLKNKAGEQGLYLNPWNLTAHFWWISFCVLYFL